MASITQYSAAAALLLCVAVAATSGPKICVVGTGAMGREHAKVRGTDRRIRANAALARAVTRHDVDVRLLRERSNCTQRERKSTCGTASTSIV
jgi:hypothetical protein